jgi:hypothetical protein
MLKATVSLPVLELAPEPAVAELPEAAGELELELLHAASSPAAAHAASAQAARRTALGLVKRP